METLSRGIMALHAVIIGKKVELFSETAARLFSTTVAVQEEQNYDSTLSSRARLSSRALEVL